MQKWNISTYRARRIDEQNDVIRLVMFTSKVMVIRISKMAHLMYFLLNTEKTDPVWARYLNASEKSYLTLLQSTMDYEVLTYHQQTVNIQKYRISLVLCWLAFFLWLFFLYISTNNISRTVQSLLNIRFSATTRWDLARVRKDIAQIVT